MTSHQVLILASGSPRRAELLQAAGIPFKIYMPNVREKSPVCLPSLTPRQLAIHNAELKAKKAAHQFPQHWILAADTLVALGRNIFGKPKDFLEAERMLQLLNGRTHRVWTGICLYPPKLNPPSRKATEGYPPSFTHNLMVRQAHHPEQSRRTSAVFEQRRIKSRLFSVTTEVTFKRLTQKQIRSYLRKIHPLDKAGAYAAQKYTDRIIHSVDGSFTNIVGLPMERLMDEFRRLQISFYPNISSNHDEVFTQRVEFAGKRRIRFRIGILKSSV